MHPLDKFAYCPVCGSQHFRINNFKSKRCDECGFTYYANPSSATAAFILRHQGQELLVARRAKNPAKGTLDLPGGFVDMDETAEEGMRREIMEETGLVVETLSYLFSIPNRYVYSDIVIHTLDMFFVTTVSDDAAPQAADDAAELMWLPLADINPDDFGLKSINSAVSRFLENRL